MSKSQTLNQFQYVMHELNSFARTKGASDKQKRKGKGLAGTIAKGAAIGTGAGLAATGGLAAAGLAGKGSAPLRRRAGAQLGALGNSIKSGAVKDLGANVKGIGKVAKNAVNIGAGRVNNALGTKAGKIGAGLVAGGALAAGAAALLKNRNKNKKK